MLDIAACAGANELLNRPGFVRGPIAREPLYGTVSRHLTLRNRGPGCTME